MLSLGIIALPYFLFSDQYLKLHEESNPSHTITALAIRDDCGATCACSTRIDLKFSNRYMEEIFRVDDCDIQITWLNEAKFTATFDFGKQSQQFNALDLLKDSG